MTLAISEEALHARGVPDEALTAEKGAEVRPESVAKIEFLECGLGDHLRHSKLVGLRDDKDPRSLMKEATQTQPTNSPKYCPQNDSPFHAAASAKLMSHFAE